MLTIELDGDVLVLISDDANAENSALSEAIDVAAPHMAESFGQTRLGDDGCIRWPVQRDDWRSLLEVVEELGCIGAAFSGPDMDEVVAVEAAVELAVESIDE